jgi:PleD family two-component response regulator
MAVHILLYDHSAVILARFQHALVKAGYRVTDRFPREMTVDQVRNYNPDALVLALTRTALQSGLEKLRPVRDHPTTLHIPVVVATPVEEDITLDIEDEGVTHVRYRNEPFNIDDLLLAIPPLVANDGR